MVLQKMSTSSWVRYHTKHGSQMQWMFLASVEVQPCSGLGSLRYVLKGLDWLLDHAKRPAVAQMSLIALGTSQSLNDMVQEVVNTGIPVVVSAGNYAASLI